MGTTVKVHCPADVAPGNWQWRDYWVKDALGKAFQDAGVPISYGHADLNVWLWGFLQQAQTLNRDDYNVLWVIGHPDALLEAINPDQGRVVFNRVYCASLEFSKKLSDLWRCPVDWLVCPPPERRAPVAQCTREVAFVGNADPAKNRGALTRLLREKDSAVYGAGWSHIMPGYGGAYIDWKMLGDIWSSAKVVPYSTHADMRREGFVADAALDVLANSNALLLADKNPGFAEIGLEEVPQWETPEELMALADEWLEKSDEDRGELVGRLRKEAKKFTYAGVVKRMLEV